MVGVFDLEDVLALFDERLLGGSPVGRLDLRSVDHFLLTWQLNNFLALCGWDIQLWVKRSLRHAIVLQSGRGIFGEALYQDFGKRKTPVQRVPRLRADLAPP